MLIEDKSGRLESLRKSIVEKQRVSSREDLSPGDIVYQCLDRKDGLVLKDSYTTRNKYFVVVGKNSKGDAVGICLVNSNLEFFGNSERKRYQYILKKDDYPQVLDRDSRIDCSTLFTMSLKKAVAVKGQKVGSIKADDWNHIISLVAECEFINMHDKKVYRIVPLEK